MRNVLLGVVANMGCSTHYQRSAESSSISESKIFHFLSTFHILPDSHMDEQFLELPEPRF